MNPSPDARQVAAIERGQATYRWACELDVAVRKPGNVSRLSPGHGMQASQFSASARASVGPLFERGARVGDRIEAAVAATWEVAGCNTNLGILLLCAPVARAIELQTEASGPVRLRAAVETVLADLDVRDTRAAYRAIARARPGGLGSAPAEDVHGMPNIGLRAAMALAADRDSIAREYRDGFAELFELSALAEGIRGSAQPEPVEEALPPWASDLTVLAGELDTPPSALNDIVQRVYLTVLASRPDSHIVRKHGTALAQSVMRSAQRWRARALDGEHLDADPAFADWDRELKAAGLNPGTSADFTVAALFIAGLVSSSAVAS